MWVCSASKKNDQKDVTVAWFHPRKIQETRCCMNTSMDVNGCQWFNHQSYLQFQHVSIMFNHVHVQSRTYNFKHDSFAWVILLNFKPLIHLGIPLIRLRKARGRKKSRSEDAKMKCLLGAKCNATKGVKCSQTWKKKAAIYLSIRYLFIILPIANVFSITMCFSLFW